MIGAVADDFTGATDLASMFSRGGMRTVLQLGQGAGPCPSADAAVVALKSRTAPVAEAVSESLSAWRWMVEGGASRCYFKYCSTFDSTPQGNIGPVAEALMRETGASQTIYTPAFPENGRSIYMGKLFVGEQLLSESGMAKHPLTPMTDADLVRLLDEQLAEGRAGLVPWTSVRKGTDAVRAALATLAGEGVSHVVVDALEQSDLDVLADAVHDWPLVTAGSGLALSIGRRESGTSDDQSASLPEIGGPTVLLSGSCSQATNAQVARWEADGGRTIRLDPLALADGVSTAVPTDALPTLFAATQPPEQVAKAQTILGSDHAASLVERELSRLAVHFKSAGVRRFVVAGGETSGAVAKALGATRLTVGPSIAPGVPWCATMDERPIALALKSGNFGQESFFSDALAVAP